MPTRSTIPVPLLRRSRALASMLPALLVSGAVTLAFSGILQALWAAADDDFVGSRAEVWLTFWPIAFPLTYLLGLLLQRIAARISEKRFDRPAQSKA